MSEQRFGTVIRGGATADRSEHNAGYGWFEGVFVPTLLTILGVILFLRTGWVVGNAGVGGGIVVIALSFAITGATAVSIAAIASNKTIGSGGAFAIIARSLGIEAGGAIGIPLYLSQTLVIALYLFGFRDGWLRIFPDHPALLIDLAGFAILVVVALISAQFAFRVQYLILALIASAIASLALGAVINGLPVTPVVWGDYPGSVESGLSGTDFWAVFAVFFPATTGIMAGANMSGELADSRRAIPLGTLLAVGVSLVVYIAAATWLAMSAAPSELVANYSIMVDLAAWGPAVLAGLLGATFSSALASLVGASRILQALAAQHLLPRSAWLQSRSNDGEPRNALYVTATVALAAVAVRELNAIAPIITLFFLITYATVNLVVLVELRLDLPSFRPKLRPRATVPAVGLLGCLGAMFVINAVFTAVGIALVIAIAVVLASRPVTSPFSDLRSAMFQRVSRWAAERAKSARSSAERSWRPNLLVPTRDVGALDDIAPFLHDIAQPAGGVKLVLHGDADDGDSARTLVQRLEDDDIAIAWSVVDARTTADAVAAGVEQGDTDAAPNIMFVGFPASARELDQARDALDVARDRRLGVLVLSHVHSGRVGGRGIVNLWVRPQPVDADPGDIRHSHLAILLALKLVRNWDGRLNLLTVVGDGDDEAAADSYLHQLIDAARLPGRPAVHVLAGTFLDGLGRSPAADANVFALSPEPDFAFMHEMIEQVDTPCAFVRDSGDENALV